MENYKQDSNQEQNLVGGRFEKTALLHTTKSSQIYLGNTEVTLEFISSVC